MKKHLVLATLLIIPLAAHPQRTETITPECTVLNLPVSNEAPMGRITIIVAGDTVTAFNIRLDAREPQYWVCHDLMPYVGKAATVSYSIPGDGLKDMVLHDSYVGADTLYAERYRPQYHFTAPYGWLNDPNGLVYLDGIYHMYYQLNPYGNNFGNMCWAHAVSSDLVRWELLPLALEQTPRDMAFSGTAMVDTRNMSGLSRDGSPPLLAFYTLSAVGRNKKTQDMAYSTDAGTTLMRYEGNPVLENTRHGSSRDPRVFLHEPTERYVMIVYDADGHSIYTSPDLKDWNYESHYYGFYECPELFELPVDGNRDNTLWVMWGASGVYMIGEFDGREFTPVTGMLQCVVGDNYATQLFSNIPREDGRCIGITVGRLEHKRLPYMDRIMTLPTEFTLRSTTNGVRLYTNPVREVDRLCRPEGTWTDLDMKTANGILAGYGTVTDGLRIRMTFLVNGGRMEGGLLLGEQHVAYYNRGYGTVNGYFYDPSGSVSDHDGLLITTDTWLDRTSVETFVDGGARAVVMGRTDDTYDNGGLKLVDVARVVSLEIWRVDAAIPSGVTLPGYW